MSHDHRNLSPQDLLAMLRGQGEDQHEGEPCDCPGCALKGIFNKEELTEADKDAIIAAIVEKREDLESRLNESNRKMHDSIEMVKRALDMNDGNIGAISIAIAPLNPMIPIINDRGELCPGFRSMHTMGAAYTSVIKDLTSDI